MCSDKQNSVIAKWLTVQDTVIVNILTKFTDHVDRHKRLCKFVNSFEGPAHCLAEELLNCFR